MTTDLKTLLITGASSFCGLYALQKSTCRFLAHKSQFSGHSTVIPQHPASTSTIIDLCDTALLTGLLKEIKPDGIIHAAAMSQPNDCQTYPDKSHRINVDTTITLARWCADSRASFAFTSSDLVFDGEHAPYRETDAPKPKSVYGLQKLEAEQGILSVYPDAAVCRMPLMFGVNGPAGKSSISLWRETLLAGKSLKLFTDEYRTPVDSESASDGLLLALQKVHGLIHLGGREHISRYDFGVLVAARLGFSTDLCIPVLQKDVIMPAPRPRDVSLDSSNAFGLGYNPLSIKDALAGRV